MVRVLEGHPSTNGNQMLTETAHFETSSPDPYKVTDRDGMYVAVSPAGTVAFRYDYRLNGRRETLTIGRYGCGGISLAEARERLLADARRAVGEGRSPAYPWGKARLR